MKRASKTLIRLVTALIPVSSWRRKIRRVLADKEDRWWLARTLPRVRTRYAAHVQSFKARLAAGEKLRVCFLVCDVSMFSHETVFQALLKDTRFAPYIAVVPRITRGDAFLRETLTKTYNTLATRYGADLVRNFYNVETRVATPLKGQADIVFTSIVYDDQTFFQYTALPISEYALVLGYLYSYGGLLKSSVYRAQTLPQLALFWRFFVSTEEVARYFNAVNPFLAENMHVGGYPKMDRLAEIPERKDRPVIILICPHHTLARGQGEILALSNFLKYADFFQQLPKLYPAVHFVFRPHPLLFPRLATTAYWGKEKTAAYRADLEAQANVEFQQGGDYFDTFVNSDGLIHDCGSFLAEYFYVGKPQCFMVETEESLRVQLTPLGERLHDHVCHAHTEAEIRAFIDRIIAGTEVFTTQQREFAQREICIGHPHATDFALQQLNFT